MIKLKGLIKESSVSGQQFVKNVDIDKLNKLISSLGKKYPNWKFKIHPEHLSMYPNSYTLTYDSDNTSNGERLVIRGLIDKLLKTVTK